MDSDHVIGLDIGTTGCKAVAVDPSGSVRATSYQEYPTITGQGDRTGWVEQDPLVIAHAVRTVLRDVSDQLSTKPAGIAVSGAMHSVIPIGHDDRPLAHAMIWPDTRTNDLAKQIYTNASPELRDRLYQRTGCPLRSPYHPIRVAWWLQYATDIANKTKRFVAIKDFVIHDLTGRWATDTGLASTTGLLNLHDLDWDDEALAATGLDRDRLPELVHATDVVGDLPASVASDIKLPIGLPVIAGGSDGPLANLGADVTTPGIGVLTVGTSGAVRLTADQPLLDPKHRVWCYSVTDDLYVAGGAINNGGLALNWVRDRFYQDLSPSDGFDQMTRDVEAARIDDSELIVLPYFCGERSPHWRSDVKAVIHGLSLEHHRGDIAQAAMQSVGFCLADVWDALNDGHQAGTTLRLTGGITKNAVWTQIVTDIMGLPVQCVQAADASSIGAAKLGHCALFGTKPDAIITSTNDRVFEPDMDRHAVYESRRSKFHDLFRKLWG